MSGAIEDVAKKWLSEPTYHKVFKHTADVVEDYICYFLTSLGAIALSVRFLSSMGSGDVVCIITGVKTGNVTQEDLGPYPSGGTNTIVSYANFNQKCIDQALTPFMQYLPFILLLQSVAIILLEKLLMKFPRVSGKIERFYGSIVEESLFGKDPDVAEDVCDDKANSEAISRRRRRNEICMGLKRSSIIHTTYILKNITEICLLFIFIPFDIVYGLDAEKNLLPSTCMLPMNSVPELGMTQNGNIFYQCEGKKVSFFLILLYVHISVLVLVFFCSSTSLIWCFFFRSISQLLEKIEKYRVDWDVDIEKTKGKDFLFLFDLLSHTSGIESTLRVLTHADETFRKICLPKLKNDVTHIKVEEDKLKVIWNPASLENWLEHNSHKDIMVDSYDVTIYPAESVNNTVTKLKKDKDSSGLYSAWFFDLQGGKTEYVITIACVIGKSRMKGERIVTTLLPYGPEKPRGGIIKTSTTDEIEIAWEPPKGGFTKYVLCVDPNVTSLNKTKSNGVNMSNGIMARHFYANDYYGSTFDFSQVNKDYTERELSNLITDHKISGLCAGETYGVELKTKTGGRFTRKPIYETVMTKPQKVQSFTAEEIKTCSAVLKWVAPEGNKRLKAYNLAIMSTDNKIRRDLAVKHNPETAVNSFLLDNILQATQYSVTITSVCVFESLKTVSEEESMKFCSLPEPPTNLNLDNRHPNSFTVKWDAPSTIQSTHKYKLSIEAPSISYSAEYTTGGDKHTFNFSKLPDIIGTGVIIISIISINTKNDIIGELYNVRVEYIVTPTGSDQEVRGKEAMINNKDKL